VADPHSSEAFWPLAIYFCGSYPESVIEAGEGAVGKESRV
jgi:hypothetical protein